MNEISPTAGGLFVIIIGLIQTSIGAAYIINQVFFNCCPLSQIIFGFVIFISGLIIVGLGIKIKSPFEKSSPK